MFPLYLAFEGSIDDFHRDIPYLKQILGPDDGTAHRQYAYSVGATPLLTRSIRFLRSVVEEVFDLAEREDVPIMFHIDPMYGFLANTEKRPEDAPAVKYWDDPEMREWLSFPAADPAQRHFAAIESYLANYRDEASFTESLREIFDNGGVIKVLFGVFGKGTPFELDPKPKGSTLAILKWLRSSKI